MALTYIIVFLCAGPLLQHILLKSKRKERKSEAKVILLVSADVSPRIRGRQASIIGNFCKTSASCSQSISPVLLLFVIQPIHKKQWRPQKANLRKKCLKHFHNLKTWRNTEGNLKSTPVWLEYDFLGCFFVYNLEYNFCSLKHISEPLHLLHEHIHVKSSFKLEVI